MTDSPSLNPDPSPEDARLAERLAAQRPVPGAGFRGALGRRLVGLDPGYGPRPTRLWGLVSLWLAAGLLVLHIGVIVLKTNHKFARDSAGEILTSIFWLLWLVLPVMVLINLAIH